MIHLLVELRLTRQWFTQCRIFASAKIKTNERIIIRSTVRVSVRYTYNNECCERVRPVSDVTGPNIPSALSSSSSLPMAVTWFCSFSRLFSPNWLDEPCHEAALPLGSSLLPTSSAIALVAVGLQSRPAQGLTSMKCVCHAADFRYPTSDLSISRQVTLSSSRNLDHAQTVDQTASLAL